MQSLEEDYDSRELEIANRVLLPDKGSFIPCDSNFEGTFVKSSTIWMQCPATPVAGVAPKPQAIIWQPRIGASIIQRYSVFTAGQYAATAVGTATPLSVIEDYFAPANAGSRWNLLNDLFIPVETGRQVELSPDLEQAMTKGRVINGVFQIISDATSTTSAAISGTLHAGFVRDTRTVPAGSPPKLAQQSVTKKDSLMNIHAQDGIVVNCGPDITSEQLDLCRQSAMDISKCEQYYYQLAAVSPAVTGTGTATTYTSLWLSPFYSLTGATTLSGTIVQQVVAQPGLQTDVTVEFEIYAAIHAAGAAADYSNLSVTAFCTYIYVVEEVVGGSVVQQFYGVGMKKEAMSGATVQYDMNAPFTVRFEPPSRENHWLFGHAIDGTQPTSAAQSKRFRWVGVSCGAQIHQGNAASTLSMAFVAQNPRLTYNKIHERGELSALICEFRNLAEGQNVNMKGVLYVEGVANGNYTPYIDKPNGPDGAIRSFNVETLKILNLLYDSEECGELRRIWHKPEYDLVQKRGGYSAEEYKRMVLEMPDRERRRVLLKYMEAGGLFGWIKDAANWVGKNVISPVYRDVIKPVARDIYNEGKQIVLHKGLDMLHGALEAAPEAAELAAGGYYGRKRIRFEQPEYDSEESDDEEELHADALFGLATRSLGGRRGPLPGTVLEDEKTGKRYVAAKFILTSQEASSYINAWQIKNNYDEEELPDVPYFVFTVNMTGSSDDGKTWKFAENYVGYPTWGKNDKGDFVVPKKNTMAEANILQQKYFFFPLGVKAQFNSETYQTYSGKKATRRYVEDVNWNPFNEVYDPNIPMATFAKVLMRGEKLAQNNNDEETMNLIQNYTAPLYKKLQTVLESTPPFSISDTKEGMVRPRSKATNLSIIKRARSLDGFHPAWAQQQNSWFRTAVSAGSQGRQQTQETEEDTRPAVTIQDPFLAGRAQSVAPTPNVSIATSRSMTRAISPEPRNPNEGQMQFAPTFNERVRSMVKGGGGRGKGKGRR